MKVLIINGSPHPKGSTYIALMEAAGQIHAAGIETEFMQIGTKSIRNCIACGKCFETGKCIFKDDPVNIAIEKLRLANGLIVGSPVYYGGASPVLCAFLNRVFFLKAHYYEYKPAACIVSCRRGGASAAFDRLNKYFTISRMPVVSSQYWNSIHGNNAQDALMDLEGLQTMRTLGATMAWMIKAFENARAHGIMPPKREKFLQTNFNGLRSWPPGRKRSNKTK